MSLSWLNLRPRKLDRSSARRLLFRLLGGLQLNLQELTEIVEHTLNAREDSTLLVFSARTLAKLAQYPETHQQIFARLKVHLEDLLYSSTSNLFLNDPWNPSNGSV